MSKEHMLALFLLAGFEVKAFWELPNGYWPESYTELRKKSPWWLVKTEFGLVKLGWRKRVISINWEELDYHLSGPVTEDEVTKSTTGVHAWSYSKAVEYLSALRLNCSTIKKVEELQKGGS